MNLYGPKQLANSARTVRKNTIQIAEDIPEKDYGYRPTPESRSVAETLVHIAFLSHRAHSSSLKRKRLLGIVPHLTRNRQPVVEKTAV